MEEIKCLVCRGKYFRKGYFDVEVDVRVYSTAYSNTDLYTEIDNSVDENGELNLYLKKFNANKKNYINSDEYTELHVYACENCGFIMQFTKEKNVESKKEEQERKKRERMYDWTDFKEEED